MSVSVLVWVCNVTGDHLTSSPRKPSPCARLGRTMPVPSRREHRMHPPSFPLKSQMPNTTTVGQHLASSSSRVHTRVVSTVPAGTQPFISNAARPGHEPFPKRVPTVLPMSRFTQLKPGGQSTLLNAHSVLMHHWYRLSVRQWNREPCTQESHTHPCLREIPCCHPSTSQRPWSTCLGSVHCVDWRYRPRCPAQQ